MIDHPAVMEPQEVEPGFPVIHHPCLLRVQPQPQSGELLPYPFQRPRGVLGQNLIFTPRVEYFPR